MYKLLSLNYNLLHGSKNWAFFCNSCSNTIVSLNFAYEVYQTCKARFNNSYFRFNCFSFILFPLRFELFSFPQYISSFERKCSNPRYLRNLKTESVANKHIVQIQIVTSHLYSKTHSLKWYIVTLFIFFSVSKSDIDHA